MKERKERNFFDCGEGDLHYWTVTADWLFISGREVALHAKSVDLLELLWLVKNENRGMLYNGENHRRTNGLGRLSRRHACIQWMSLYYVVCVKKIKTMMEPKYVHFSKWVVGYYYYRSEREGPRKGFHTRKSGKTSFFSSQV